MMMHLILRTVKNYISPKSFSMSWWINKHQKMLELLNVSSRTITARELNAEHFAESPKLRSLPYFWGLLASG